MKRYTKYIVVAIACLSAVAAYSQTNLRSLYRFKEPKDIVQPPVESDKPVDKPNVAAKADTAYCFMPTKRNGWFEPLGMLTKEQAKHRDRSYMFTGKNLRGHWTKMEAIDAHGRYVDSGISPYILRLNNERDSLVNTDWAQKLTGSCIFEFIPDPSGENIIQERAFDKDYNLLYSYSRVPIGNNQFIGSYRDIYGLPAEMRADENYSYGTLVLITQDEAGFDKKIQYIDSKGVSKPNGDNAFAEMFEYDAYGRRILQCSVDSIGNNIKDKWGNCAIINTFDENHLTTSSMYTDEFLKPMRMPSVESGKNTGTIKSKYEYDDYFRNTTVKFVTEDDEPDTNTYGCHKIVYEYDDYGQMVKGTGYGLDGNLAPQDASGTAIFSSKYNDSGDLVLIEFLDVNEAPVSTPDYLCKKEFGYDSHHSKFSEIWISRDSGLDEIKYSFETTKFPGYTEEKKVINDGSSTIIQRDKKKREILIAYYDEDGSRTLNPEEPWSYKVTEYDEIGSKKTRYTTSYYDREGRLSQSGDIEFNKEIIEIDSIPKQMFIKQYKNELLVNTYSRRYNDDFTIPIEQADNNMFGDICRAGGVSGVRCYNAKVKWTPFTVISSIVCEDEFGEPDYLSADNGDVFYYKRMTSEGELLMSTENEVIDSSDTNDIHDTLPKVMTIEVTDPKAYHLGIRDNDVILIYGDYSANLVDIPSCDDFRRNWALASIIEAGKSSRMVVFRIEDAKNNKYGLVEINDLKGTPSEMGFLAHIRYLTDRQTDRILLAIRDEMISSNPIVTAEDFNKGDVSDGDNYVLFAYPDMYRRTRDKPYPKHITDPALLLGACIKDRDLYWELKDGLNTANFESMLASRDQSNFRNPVMHYYLTTDMTNVKPLALTDAYGFTKWFDARISDEHYNALLKVSRKSSSELDSIRSKSPTFKRNNLIAKWEIAHKDDQQNYSEPEGHLSFSKDGTCKGSLSCYGLIQFAEGIAKFRIDRNYAGNWQLCDSLIRILPQAEDNMRLTCIDLIGADDDLKERALAYVNSICNSNKEYYLGAMVYYGVKWNNELFIHSLNEDSLAIDVGEESPIVLSRVKKIAKREPQNIKPKKDKEYVKQRKKNKKVNSPLIGIWETIMTDALNSEATLVLEDEQGMNLSLKGSDSMSLTETMTYILTLEISMGGTWDYANEILTLIYDPASLAIKLDIEIEGSESEEVTTFVREQMLQEFEPHKVQIAMEILNNNAFLGEMSVSDITESSFIMDDRLWTRRN